MHDKEEPQQKLKHQIDIWLNRALMAYQQDKMDLTKTALDKRWEYQKALAELEGSPPPPAPEDPKRFFRDWDQGPGFGRKGRDPDQPAPVPLRPYPAAGAGEIALPLPESSEN
jgi:hypothetical protein